ncbi:hypothetical protein GGI42DRAFT_337617 [Trichoderma sp. SZMC 28013]
MCFYFISRWLCPDCNCTIRRFKNRVPCWNGSLYPWNPYHYGLVCQSRLYERSEDEIHMDKLCYYCREAREKARKIAEGSQLERSVALLWDFLKRKHTPTIGE